MNKAIYLFALFVNFIQGPLLVTSSDTEQHLISLQPNNLFARDNTSLPPILYDQVCGYALCNESTFAWTHDYDSKDPCPLVDYANTKAIVCYPTTSVLEINFTRLDNGPFVKPDFSKWDNKKFKSLRFINIVNNTALGSNNPFNNFSSQLVEFTKLEAESYLFENVDEGVVDSIVKAIVSSEVRTMKVKVLVFDKLSIKDLTNQFKDIGKYGALVKFVVTNCPEIYSIDLTFPKTLSQFVGSNDSLRYVTKNAFDKSTKIDLIYLSHNELPRAIKFNFTADALNYAKTNNVIIDFSYNKITDISALIPCDDMQYLLEFNYIDCKQSIRTLMEGYVPKDKRDIDDGSQFGNCSRTTATIECHGWNPEQKLQFLSLNQWRADTLCTSFDSKFPNSNVNKYIDKDHCRVSCGSGTNRTIYKSDGAICETKPNNRCCTGKCTDCTEGNGTVCLECSKNWISPIYYEENNSFELYNIDYY